MFSELLPVGLLCRVLQEGERCVLELLHGQEGTPRTCSNDRLMDTGDAMFHGSHMHNVGAGRL